MFEKVEGIVLRTKEYGETHKIVTLFSREKGKFGIMAKGAKKPKSRMASITQPFIHGHYLVQTGRNLGSLSQGEVISSLRGVREDIIKTAYAAYLAEMTDKMVEDKQPDPFLFQQFLQTLIWITEDKDPEILTMMYELKLYKKAGFAPQLEVCVNCSNENGPFSFSVKEGGFLCFRCKHIDPEAYGLTEKMASLLRLFAHVDVARVGNITIKEENKRKIRRLMDAYYDYYGGYYIKSKKFLKQLDLFKPED
ncbi:DNA repair protein RecO [Thalassobacillus devorans]|uniref:DNA repair protein RecO n=1 Tax=Thalassobacillus devorans TaxID=279813 RepID=A0ABQ1P6C8_9BACI|nr:DNA repair protein RecO [Thalassobacillus devorans]NIK29686.1 DNA repair protein RecO (recombination protein O) [Thalassobacillus devorans]GGC92012.1 DNA repair protein RecO [Thalassobacillus devorans]